MERVILHCDANSFYASVEMLYNPAIRDKPVAVGGSVEDRHGIILTKNQLAKRYGVKTGEAIWQAKQKCPDLVCVPPDYPLYLRFGKKMRRLYEQYSDRVESFGLDEAWVDLSNPGFTLADGERTAQEIRRRVREELGITVSVGVSFNKIFAKLGSDLKKPDAVTVIPRESFREQIGPLPVGELLYVGPSTRRRLARLNVTTIGQLADLDGELARMLLGKNGLLLKSYAMGLDRSPVMPTDFRSAIKSVGNSTTPPHDICSLGDARCILSLLAESVAARLREEGVRARCVTVYARSTELITRSHQRTMRRATALAGEIAPAAMALFQERFGDGLPYRSVGISCSMLEMDGAPVQLDLLGDEERRMTMEQLEKSVDGLRRRFGHQVVQRGVTLTDRSYARINPVEDHTIHPVPFYSG